MTEKVLQDPSYRSFGEWTCLVFGVFDAPTVAEAVASATWQSLRGSLIGEPLQTKFAVCYGFANPPAAARVPPEELRLRRIAVTNYVYALKRGGLIV